MELKQYDKERAGAVRTTWNRLSDKAKADATWYFLVMTEELISDMKRNEGASYAHLQPLRRLASVLTVLANAYEE